VERPLEGDQPVAAALPLGIVKAPGHLEGAFERLDSGIGEEHRVGKRRLHEPLCQPLALRDAVEVRGMPQPRRLLAQRLDQMRMGVAQRIDSHPRAEIEILAAVLRGQSRPPAGDECHRMPVVDREDR
jgi:hypothetical protein